MARRRMFSLDIVDTDAFLDLPASSQSLYFHLGMRADDDGFISSPRRIASTVNASADDLKLLIAKGFIIPFASGVCVVRDWRINNYIQRDRYTPTLYAEEKSQLESGKNGRYLPLDTKCIQNVSKSDTQVRLGKDNIIPSPTAQSTDKGNDASFSTFWNAYPRKVGKGAAQKAFSKIKVPLTVLLSALEQQKQSDQWKRDGGRYIPYPATWLNQKRWEDEPPAQPEKDMEPAEDWTVTHPEWADQSTWVPGPDGVYRPVGVMP